jgi:hypothetical protein
VHSFNGLDGPMQADEPRSVTLNTRCICGVPYERSEKIAEVRDFNSAVCAFCGAALATWCSFHVPVYRLKKRAPDEKRTG